MLIQIFPDRIKDGYGLNKMLIDRALDDGIDTIITCDNGLRLRKKSLTEEKTVLR